MDDMSGILARDFGIRPQGKAAPMAATKTAATNRSTSSSAWTGNPSSSYDDFFSTTANSKSTVSQPHDPILDTFNKGPVFDTPVYDDDMFDGIPGVRSSTNMGFDDVFGSGSRNRNHVESPPAYDDLLGSLGNTSSRVDRSRAASPPPYDDLLGGLGTGESKADKNQGSMKPKDPDLSGFDDLLPGFGSSVPPQPKREAHETDLPKPPKPAPSVQDDPFSVFETVTSTPSVPSSGLFSNPLDEFTRSASASGSAKVDPSPTTDNLFSENHNSFESGPNHNGREKSADFNGSFREKDNPKVSARDTSPMNSFHEKSPNERSPTDDFEMPRGQAGHRPMGSASFSRNKKLMEDPSPESSENSETGEDVWLTVSEIPLFTRPTSAPPPSRPPPPLTVQHKPSQNYSFNKDSSPVDDLEDFAMGKPYAQKFDDEGEMERSSAAMKDAMNKAEAKFRHAKEVREKMRSKEAEQLDREDAEREIAEKEHEEREKERERRRIEREEEEKRRKEREDRERARMAVERATREARERAANEAKLRAERAAVLRAQQEARERAAADARERAAAEAREKAERLAREKAAAEAAIERERVEREAREKAAAERLGREKAERERQRRDERAAVERAAAEARERLAQAARERHQQQSQAQQRKPDTVQQRRPDPPQPQRAPEDDLESFFGARASSAPRPTRSPASAESLFETQTQTRVPNDTSRRAASVSGASIPKAASINMMDDLSAIFGGPSSGGEFQEIEGEPEERRRARFERERKTQERAAQALREKNERDLQAQREQDEKHRIGESLDFEIKRWAAGKEGNLRALLSSLHYILWQECGWQPVSMADLITGAAVKKVYRKATLCVHPDKVQQKGATIQQKYIAEKVFDILKEAWNKFNSEELF